MEQITFPSIKEGEIPELNPIPPNGEKWDAFYQSFTQKEKETFSSTFIHSITLSTQKDLKKMKEAARKLKESNK